MMCVGNQINLIRYYLWSKLENPFKRIEGFRLDRSAVLKGQIVWTRGFHRTSEVSSRVFRGPGSNHTMFQIWHKTKGRRKPFEVGLVKCFSVFNFVQALFLLHLYSCSNEHSDTNLCWKIIIALTIWHHWIQIFTVWSSCQRTLQLS